MRNTFDALGGLMGAAGGATESTLESLRALKRARVSRLLLVGVVAIFVPLLDWLAVQNPGPFESPIAPPVPAVVLVGIALFAGGVLTRVFGPARRLRPASSHAAAWAAGSSTAFYMVSGLLIPGLASTTVSGLLWPSILAVVLTALAWVWAWPRPGDIARWEAARAPVPE